MGCDEFPDQRYPDDTDRDPFPRTVYEDFSDRKNVAQSFSESSYEIYECYRCGNAVFSRLTHIEVCK